jgi:hypothetical protein
MPSKKPVERADYFTLVLFFVYISILKMEAKYSSEKSFAFHLAWCETTVKYLEKFFIII